MTFTCRTLFDAPMTLPGKVGFIAGPQMMWPLLLGLEKKLQTCVINCLERPITGLVTPATVTVVNPIVFGHI